MCAGKQANGKRANGHASDHPSEEEAFWGRKTTHVGQRTIYGNVWPEDRGGLLKAKQRLYQRFEDGTIKATVDDKPFAGVEQTSDAVDYMLTGQALGKVVVRM